MKKNKSDRVGNRDGAPARSGAPPEFPRDFLTPWVLLVLRNWSMHGYQLMQTLTMFGLASFEPTTVYRTLRRLQKTGLIMSAWETGDSGPAKRVYSLTDAGEEFLRTWASALRQYQGLLVRFTEVYSQGQRLASKEDAHRAAPAKAEEAK
ncbi:MAG: helix-turn-helix transcriptional regulator [Chloroflexi bacterium]|nr:helix-turn-helix transcriptional regulator [Chloroflexota bacterium]